MADPCEEHDEPGVIHSWRTVAASVQGRSHEARDEPCQDASAIAVTDTGVLIVAVSDGAGSACRSQEGSAIAVNAAMRFLQRALADDSREPVDLEAAIRQAFTIAWIAIARHARETAAPIRNFHATLVCIVVAGDATAIGHIGDSVAVIERESGALELVANPEHGEYVNMTYFLTQLPVIPHRMHTRQITGRIDAVALSSDGLLEVAFTDPYGDCEPMPGFFGTLFRRMRNEPDGNELRSKVTALLQSPKIRNLTSDDVTLALAVRIAESAIEEPVEMAEDPAHPRTLLMAATGSLVLNDGTPLTLAAQIGKPGGEGTTYRIAGSPNLVVKIYHTPASSPTIEKLSWMIAHPPAGVHAGQGNVVLAWPQSLVKERSSGKVVGFTMPLIAQSWEISRVCDPALRRHLKTSHGEQIGWHHLHEIAFNLARVVESCHATGYVVGDLNNNNTRVSNTGQISLIDTDSFQVTVYANGKKHIHYCNVVYPDFTPPELIGKDLSKTERTAETDCFILALLIFKLLQDKTHAFQGASNDQSLNDPIVLVSKGWFPYSTRGINQLVQPHPLAPPFARLHSDLRALFQRAFVDGHSKPHLRPTASEWATALQTARQSLQRCARQHYYTAQGTSSFCMQRVQALGGGYCGSTAKNQRSTPIPFAEINSLTGERIKAATSKKTTAQSPPVAPKQTTFTPPSTPGGRVPPPSPGAIKKSSLSESFRRGLVVLVVSALMVLALVPTGYGARLIDSARQFQEGSPGSGVTTRPGGGAAAPGAATLLASQPVDGLILFSAHQASGWSLNLLDPENGNETVAFDQLSIDPVPAWSHDGGRIAYAVRSDSGTDVRFIRSSTGKTARIGSLPGSSRVTRIAWSNDGATLLLSISEANGPRIITMDIATGRTAAFLPVSSINLATSANGDTAYSVEQRGDLDIVVGDRHGTACCYAAKSNADERDPSFSPDGTLIAFDTASGAEHRVAMDNRDAASRVTVPDPSQGASNISTMPVWSPKGDRIAFIACVSDRCRIFSTALTGTSQTSNPKILLSTSRYDRITSLSWYGSTSARIEPT